MTAPSPTARQTPGGRKLGSGFPILVTFSLDPDAEIHEMKVTPFGLDGGDLNETTSMHNTQWRTFSPKQLMTGTEVTISGQYDPVAIVSFEAMINVPQTITEHYPDGSSLAYYGVVTKYAPGELSEDVPNVTVTVKPTNQDPVTCLEEGPTFSPGTGTSASC